MNKKNFKGRKKYEHITHPFPPLYDADSKILILGSLPSVKSREQMFFYGHPQNRFWKVISAVLHENVPTTIEEKKTLLLTHHIALWDTIYSCDIIGSSDSSIKNVVPTDLRTVVEQSKIQHIYCNGRTSGKYFEKYQQKNTGNDSGGAAFHKPCQCSIRTGEADCDLVGSIAGFIGMRGRANSNIEI